MESTTAIRCEHSGAFPELNHDHRVITLDAEGRAELTALLLGAELREFGAEVTKYCPGCPSAHFHVEVTSAEGLTVAGSESREASKPKSRAGRLAQWDRNHPRDLAPNR